MPGILPPPPWYFVWQMLLLPIGLLFIWLLWRGRKQRKRTNITTLSVLALLVCLFFAGWLLQPIARIPREYYQGKDQFEWVRQLGAQDSQARHEAVLALCEILKSSKSGMRLWIVQQLRHRGPEAKDAVPVLIELLKDDDQVLRQEVRMALEQIHPTADAKLPKEESPPE